MQSKSLDTSHISAAGKFFNFRGIFDKYLRMLKILTVIIIIIIIIITRTMFMVLSS